MKQFLLALACVCMTSFLWGQRTISGTITNEADEPLIGASVYVQGNPSSGTITDFEGQFELRVSEDAEMLVVSYTGYETREVEIGASNTVNVTLAEGVTLDEAVVTALGINREEKSLGYSVTKLDGDEIAEAKETNIVNSLHGKVSGVQISGTNSGLGGSNRILIRGANSFLGDNQPLFVIDGVPISNQNFASNSQMIGFGGATAYDYGNMAQDIDPQSIEDMTVLKGAAASALYGQRGANGVILITTKDGAGQKGIGVEISSNTSFEDVINLMPHQQVYGGGALNENTSHGFNEVIDTDGQTYLYPAYSKDGSWGPKYEGQQVRHWDSWDPESDKYRETRPWEAPENGYEEFFQTGVTTTNSIGLSGANDQGSFRAGYTNLYQTDVMPEGDLQRHSLSLNTSYNLADWLQIGLDGNYIRTDAEGRTITGYNNGNPMQAFTQWWQTQLDLERLKDDTRSDGSQQTWNPLGPQRDPETGELIRFDHEPNFFDNPYWARRNYLQEDGRNRFFGNANVSMQFTEQWSLNTRFGTDFYQFSLREGIPLGSVAPSYYGETERRFQESNIESRLNYDNRFGNISLSAFVGGNIMRQGFRETDANTTGGILLPGFFNLANSANSPVLSTFESNKGINSVFGAASLGFNDWIYVDVSARNDWSSTLPADQNSYFYPSISASFVLSELDFMRGSDFFSFLKLRASYAEVGIDTDPYNIAFTYEPLTPNFEGNPRYSVPNSSPNFNLAPERTSEYEVGLDVRILNDRVILGASYFDRSSINQIFNVPVSAATGVTSRLLNSGEMRNSGFEFQLAATVVQTADFSWNIGLNGIRQYNEVVELAEGVESINRGATWAADLRVQKDRPYMSIFGQDYVYHENGQRLVDEEGRYVQTPERVYLGSAIPDWTGGVSTRLNYKGVSLSGLIDFQQGGAIHSTSLQWAKYSGMHPETVEFNGVSDVRENGLILPGVKADGSPNDIAINPQAYYQGTFGFAAPNVYDASFLKLRELRLSYTLPKWLLGNSFLQGASVSVYGRNLAILAADLPYLDPQIISGAGNDQGLENAQVPSRRTIGFNINFKF